MKNGVMDFAYWHFNPKQWHHLYLGIAIAVLGKHLHSEGLYTAGVIIASDDAFQHICQGYLMYGWTFQSPLAKIPNRLYATKFWAWLSNKFTFLKND